MRIILCKLRSSDSAHVVLNNYCKIQKGVKTMEQGKKDLIIVGSGPAGLSAAVYAKRAGLDLLVLEKNPLSGGQVLNTYEVDNYLGMPGIGGFEMGMQFRQHADRLGVAFEEAFVSEIRRVKDSFYIEAEGKS